MTNNLWRSGWKILKAGVLIFSGFLLFASLLIAILHLPFAQKKLAEYISNRLSEQTKTKFHVNGLRFRLGDELKLVDVYIEDQKEKTLLFSEEIIADPNWSALLNKKIIIEDLIVRNANLTLYRSGSGQEFNYQFLLDSFKDTTSGGEPWGFSIEQSYLEKVRFNYLDEQEGITIASEYEQAKILFKSLGITDLHMVVSTIELVKADVSLLRKVPVDTTESVVNRLNRPPFQITVLNGIIQDSDFQFRDLTSKPTTHQKKTLINYADLDINDLNGTVDRFYYSENDNIQISVASVALKEKSGFVLNELSGLLNLTENAVTVEANRLITPHSYFDNNYHIEVPLDLDPDKFIVNASFDKDTLSQTDLAYFVDAIKENEYLVSDKVIVSGLFNGGLPSFKANNILITSGKDLYYKGSFQVQDFSDLSRAKFRFTMDRLNIAERMLRKISPVPDTLINMNAVGDIAASGNIEGRLLNPVAKLTLSTRAGAVSAHGKFSFDTTFKFSGYKGDLTAQDLKLGKLIGSNRLGEITFNGNIVTTAREIKGYEVNIQELDFNNYKYSNIYSLGKFKDKEIVAVLKSMDSSFQTDVKFRADLTTDIFKIIGEIGYVDLAKINVSQKPLSVSGMVNAEWSGLHPDSIEGKAVIGHFSLSSRENTIRLDSIVATSVIDNGIHTMQVESEDLQAGIKGKYKFNALQDAALHLAHHYYSYIPHPKTVYHPEWLEFYIRGNDFQLVSELMGIQNIDSVDIQGSFNAPTHFTHIEGSIGSLTLNDQTLKDLSILINAGQDTLVVNTKASEISLAKDVSITHPVVNTTISNDNLVFDIHLFDPSDPTYLNMEGEGKVSKDTVSLSLTDAEIIVKGKEWDVDKENSIVFSPGFLKVRDLTFEKDSQSVVINTSLTRDYETLLGVVLNDVELGELAELAGARSYNATGRLNGEVVVADLFHNPGVEGDLTIDSLSLNNKVMGDLKLQTLKAAGMDSLYLNADLSGSFNHAVMNGYYYLNKPNALDFILHLDKLDLYPLQPFLNEHLFLLKGDVAGDLRISGTAESPSLTGALNLTGNKVGIRLTNTVFTVQSEKVLFANSGIDLNQILLTDSLQNTAELDGMVYYSGMNDVRLDLRFKTERFQLLNTNYSPDQPFYGEVIADVKAKVSGPVEDVTIQLDLTTVKGTKFFIPIAPPVVTGGLPSYIKFEEIDEAATSPSDSVYVLNPKAEWIDTIASATSGLWRYTVKGRLNVTRDAQMNVVLDPVNRDMITGKGEGDFRIDFESSGDLDIYGTYVLESGKYQYSLLDLVTKDFTIEKGSSISWSGNPLEGRMNVTANYKTKASVYELVQEQETLLAGESEQAARTRVPVEVLLYVRGELLSPQITFDITLPESEGTLTDNLVSQRISQIRTNQTELNRQVVSLIAFNRFMATGQGVTGISGGDMARTQVSESVSQVLNEQLGRLTDEYIKGIDLDVIFEALDPGYGAFAQKARVSASKKINDRITVRAGGNVNVGTTNGNGQIAGDYYGYYRINKSGSLNFKFFRTGLQTIYASTLYSISGASLTYKREFNHWKNIFKKNNEQ